MRSILPIIVASMLLGGAALAHSGATGVVQHRMETMKSLGAAMKTLSAMVRGKTEYDPARVRRAAQAIEKHGGEALLRLFPEGSNPHPSEARDLIWRDWDRFKALADALSDSAARLAADADRGEPGVRAGFKRLADSCRTCHKEFRQRRN